jgi:hypothetical protein
VYIYSFILNGHETDLCVLYSNWMVCVVDRLRQISCSMTDVLAVHIYVSNMADFAVLNKVYKKYFSSNPPVRYVTHTRGDNVGSMLSWNNEHKTCTSDSLAQYTFVLY